MAITYRSCPMTCPSCNGRGFISNPDTSKTTTSSTMICPACNGNKTVIVKETDLTKPK